MAVITCLYGESITAYLTNAPDGIEASLVVNVLAPDGVTVVWTTTGVTDAGTGLYTQVIPVTWSTTGHEVTAGTISYLIQWVYGATPPLGGRTSSRTTPPWVGTSEGSSSSPNPAPASTCGKSLAPGTPPRASRCSSAAGTCGSRGTGRWRRSRRFDEWDTVSRTLR